ITERKKREKQKRRNDILDAAEKVFFSGDFKDATVDDVAAEAELSKATLYLYFESKEDMYLAVNMRGMNRLREMFEKVAAREERGIDSVRAIGRAYYEFSKKYPDYSRAMVHFEKKFCALDEKTGLATQMHETGQSVLELVRAALRAGIEDGSIRPDLDPETTALLLWAQSDGVINLIHGTGEHLKECHGVEPDDLMEASFDLLSLALSPEEER
ncbi:MAG: TetR/AcrR family transcriptional regulator, partial [bacterium]